MKKIVYLLLFVSFLLLGCSKTTTKATPDVPNPNGNEGTKENSNIAVIYFSATNTTEKVATYISNHLDCDLIEIIPSNPYTTSDLDYNKNDSRANLEQNNPDSRPKIANSISGEKYDTFFIGYPIWWGKLPKILYTFFDTYDLSNYTIIPFCTSGGSGIQTSVSEIKNLEGNATVLDGKRFSSNATDKEILEWIQSISLSIKEEEIKAMKIEILLDNASFIATLEDNASAKELYEHIKENPLTLNLEEYGGFEKVGPLGFSLPRNDTSIDAKPGDIVLYNGNQISIFYGSNSWNYTLLGRIDSKYLNDLGKILSNSNSTVTIKMLKL